MKLQRLSETRVFPTWNPPNIFP